MKQIQVYHNKRCSKSNQALNYLKKLGWTDENLKIILYLQDGLTEQQIRFIIEHLQDKKEELIRIQDAKKLGVEVPKNIDESWIVKQLLETPQILQRPIIVFENKAIIARNIEKIDTLFI